MTEDKKTKEVEEKKTTEKKVEEKKETKEIKKTGEKKVEKEEIQPEAHEAYCCAKNLPVSTKASVEICSFIRGKELEKAKKLLQQVIDKKIAVPYKRYNRDVGHKPGKIAAGRYPEKACKEILRLLNLVQANAENKGLDRENLIITEIMANRGYQQAHYGRKRSRKFKRTHFDIFVKEIEK